MSLRPRPRAAWLTGLVFALVGALAGASPAFAGTFEVLSGSAAPGNVNNAWTDFNSRTSHLVTGTTLPAQTSQASDYPAVSYLDGLWAGSRLQAPNGATPAGSEAGWAFAAPTDTRITGLTYRRYLGAQDDDNWMPFLRDATGAVVSGETCRVSVTFRCQVGGSGDTSSSERSIAGLSTSKLEVGIHCDASNACLNGYSLYLAWASIYRSRVTVNDPTNPTVSGESGELAGPGPHSGTRSITFDASDNTGLKELRLYVDGAQATSSSRSCDYTRPRPCADVADASLSIDTVAYSDGAHTLQVAAVDAGGNETRGTARTVVFSNPRSVPAPSSDGGGGGDGDSNDGGSSSGGSSESSSAPAPAVTSSPAPTLLAANLRLARPRVRAGRLTLSGTIAPRASGSIALTCSARVGGRSRRIRGRGAIAGGRFAGRVPLRSLRGARRCSLTVSYAGNGLVAGQMLRRTIRMR